MTETSDEVLALSDVDAGDADEGTTSPTPATVPKKRGRPTNAEKPKKAATLATVRGRGRPAKGSEAVNKKVVKTATSDGSEEEGTGSDEGSAVFNGDSADSEAAVPSKRGRKPKAKRKPPHTVEATGKGRGRPKKVAKPDDGEDDDEATDDDDDDGASNDKKSGKKTAAKGAKKGRGRPKKINNSDDESSDDKEEWRPVGRPSSGGVNLNIVSSGKGQGRPKKSVVERRAAESTKKATENNDGESPKRPLKSSKGPYVPTGKPRGRPLKSSYGPHVPKGPYVPTGKPRGRPKTVQNIDSQNEVEDSEMNSIRNKSSADEERDDHANGESVEAC